MNPYSTTTTDASGIVNYDITYTIVGASTPVSRNVTGAITITGSNTHDNAAIGAGSHSSTNQTNTIFTSSSGEGWYVSSITINSLEVINTNTRYSR